MLSLIPTALWQAIGGIVLALMGWAGFKVYGRAAERKGAVEALQKQETQGAQARRKADAEVARAGDADRIGELQRWER